MMFLMRVIHLKMTEGSLKDKTLHHPMSLKELEFCKDLYSKMSNSRKLELDSQKWFQSRILQINLFLLPSFNKISYLNSILSLQSPQCPQFHSISP